jgi:mannose-6-phosphate isomerase-like protein (cupin superfamily)
VQGANIHETTARLRAGGGGYEVVHESAGLELGVYVPPSPDPQTPHREDEVYVVVEGTGAIMIDGVRHELAVGDQAYVAANVEHRFVDHDGMVLLVIFNGPHSAAQRA